MDELGQEGDEEDRDLRVEELDEHAPEEEPRATAPDDDLLRLFALEQLARAEVEQVGGSGVPDDGEGGGRGGDHPGEPGGGGQRIGEGPGLHTEHRHDARGAPLVQGARGALDAERAGAGGTRASWSSHGGERTAGSFKMIRRPPRSEERGVGKECRSRWSPYH